MTQTRPADRLLVLIPANCWHGILPVVTEPTDCDAGRFTLRGCLHDRRLLEVDPDPDGDHDD